MSCPQPNLQEYQPQGLSFRRSPWCDSGSRFDRLVGWLVGWLVLCRFRTHGKKDRFFPGILKPTIKSQWDFLYITTIAICFAKGFNPRNWGSTIILVVVETQGYFTEIVSVVGGFHHPSEKKHPVKWAVRSPDQAATFDKQKLTGFCFH